MGEPNALGIFPELKAGFAEMLSPGGITGSLFFVIFLHFAVRQRRDLGVSAASFILGNALMKFLILLGVMDRLTVGNIYGFLIIIFYFLFALAAIGIGVVFFRDWAGDFAWGTLSGRRSRLKLIFLGPDSDLKGKTRRFLNCLGQGLLLGLILGFFQSVWGCDQSLALIVIQMYSPGKEPSAWLLVAVYLLAVEFLLIAIIFGIRRVWMDQKLNASLQNHARQVRIALAAVFLAYGISFLFAYGESLLASLHKIFS